MLFGCQFALLAPSCLDGHAVEHRKGKAANWELAICKYLALPLRIAGTRATAGLPWTPAHIG